LFTLKALHAFYTFEKSATTKKTLNPSFDESQPQCIEEDVRGMGVF
jgi:hypothetical protein